MSINLIFILILFSALCHAIWSAIIKSSSNPLSLMGITSLMELIFFIPLTPVVIPFHVEFLSRPKGVMNPIPVTTTFLDIFSPKIQRNSIDTNMRRTIALYT